MVFCNLNGHHIVKKSNIVTILILIDGFLQYVDELKELLDACSHNPYFNRWFSAIHTRLTNAEKKELSQSLF